MPTDQIAVYNQWDHLKSRDAMIVREVVDKDRIALVWPRRIDLERRSYVYVSDRPMVEEAGSRRYTDPRETRFHRRVVARSNRIYSSEDVTIYLATPRERSVD